MTTPPQPQHQPQQPWYKKPGCIIPLILTIGLLLLLGGCMAIMGKAVDDTVSDLDREYEVTYQVTGESNGATVTYNTGETETAQDTGAAAGWEKTVTVKGIFGAHMTVTNGAGGGSVTCRIVANGKQISENTANGEFATATCSPSSDDLKNAFDN